MNRLSALLLLALPLCLQACASPDSYPSLSRRPAERVTGTAQPAAPDASLPEAPPASAALQTNVEQLIKQAKAADDDFEARRDGTGRAVAAAKGSAVASESWVAAMVALASLRAARSGALTSLAEIDQLYADERIAKPETVTPSAALLGSAREQVNAWVDRENEVIDTLQSQLDR